MNTLSPTGRIWQLAQLLLLLVPLASAFSRTAADVGFIAIGLLFLIESARQKNFSWLRERWVMLAIALWLYVIARGFFAEDVEGAMKRALTWGRYPLGAAAMAYWILADAKARARLMISLSATVTFLICDTALQYFSGFDILGREPVPPGSLRLTGPFTSPRIGITLLWLAIPTAIYWLMATGGTLRSGKKFWFGLLMSVGMLAVIFMSGERMALLLTGLAFALAFFLLPLSKRFMIGIGVLGALVVVVLALTNPGLLGRNVDSTSQVVGDFNQSQYGQIWHSAIEMTKEYPVFGVGLRQFRLMCPRPEYGPMDKVADRCNQHPHNIYLEWLSESGIVGLGLFIALIVAWGRTAQMHYHDLRADPVFLGLLIALIVRLWPLASSASFFTAWAAIPFWLLLGWFLAVIQYKKG